MRILHHLWLSPQCRKVRIVLLEKKIEFELRVEKVWERREPFLALNPAGEVPVLVDRDPPLFARHPRESAEVRRLVAWFDRKFDREVTENLVGEKVMKRFLGLGEPRSSAIRAGLKNVHAHLDYIAYLIERRKWLAGEQISLADFAAAAHLSTVDYLGDVPWNEHEGAKDWYVRIKSRPSFRPLLADHIPGVAPPKHYANLDF
jgi:glutathione S-transferase